MTKKTALKLGSESHRDISDVLYEDIDIVNSSRGGALWMRNGGTYSNVFWRDIKMDLVEFSGETWTGEPMRFDYDDPYGTPGNIKNIYAERINSNAPYRSFYGRSASNGTTRYVEDVVLQDCLWQL